MRVDDLSLLLRVAETGSMTLAAHQIHQTPAAVSATIRRVERQLGVRIFERTTRSVRPTEDGATFLDGCREVVERWQETIDQLGEGASLQGTINLSAPADTTYQVIEEVLSLLADDHPDLRVVVSVTDAVQQLRRDAIDLAIRYGAMPDSSLTARRLAETPSLWVASPSYVKRHGAPQHPDELTKHSCLTLHRGNVPASRWRFHDVNGDTFEREIDSARCGNGYLARRWAVAGTGIALKSLFDVINDLETGQLVRVLPAFRGDRLAIHAVFPSRSFLPARVRVLADVLSEQFQERQARCDRWLDD